MEPSAYTNLNYSPAKVDLKPGSNIIKYLNSGSVVMPSNIEILNLTGFYNDFIQTDLAVWIFESENPYIGHSYIQLYQNTSELIYNQYSNPFGLNVLHTQIHQNNILSHDGECTTPVNTNIFKIRDFINDQPVASCVGMKL